MFESNLIPCLSVGYLSKKAITRHRDILGVGMN